MGGETLPFLERGAVLKLSTFDMVGSDSNIVCFKKIVLIFCSRLLISIVQAAVQMAIVIIGSAATINMHVRGMEKESCVKRIILLITTFSLIIKIFMIWMDSQCRKLKSRTRFWMEAAATMMFSNGKAVNQVT